MRELKFKKKIKTNNILPKYIFEDYKNLSNLDKIDDKRLSDKIISDEEFKEFNRFYSIEKITYVVLGLLSFLLLIFGVLNMYNFNTPLSSIISSKNKAINIFFPLLIFFVFFKLSEGIDKKKIELVKKLVKKYKLD
jgi:thiosulfate reductase cytochrome b subunit